MRAAAHACEEQTAECSVDRADAPRELQSRGEGLLSDFDMFSFDFLGLFNGVEEVHFSSWMLLACQFSFMLWDEGRSSAPLRALFPKLTTIHVYCGGQPKTEESTLIEHLASALRARWGSTLQSVVLHRPDILYNTDFVLSKLKSILGAARISIRTDPEGLTCCQYSYCEVFGFIVRPRENEEN